MPVADEPADLKVLVGSPGAGLLPGPDLPDGTLLLDLGPDHPSRAGLLELDLWLSDDHATIRAADVRVGALHRGVEKLFEVRDYRQVLMLANRHDWHAPFAGELVVALAVEDLLGLVVPERAVLLRMVLAEHTRISSHLGFLGWPARRIGDLAPLHPIREQLRIQLLALTGNRVHPMITRLGGLAIDAGEAWLTNEVTATAAAAHWATELLSAMDTETPVAPGITPVTTEVIEGYGLSGPVARAAGIDLDVRRLSPYLDYAGHPPPTTPPVANDAPGRLRQLAAEVATSAELIRTLVDRLADTPEPVEVPLPKVIKAPEAETYVATEAPLGRAGCHLVSRGQATPWRLRLRTPSAATVSALPAILPGCPVPELEGALASLGYVVGDVDK
ncbi:NADH-quinone oxidoreductase subunit D [Enemella sp. A6]|uniref:NADH-quinone oxidoreductase subunit D-related protein n=1 Tax=Enemella sp. A6 TaxID=3440152 RepID=UPI003EBA26E5